MVFWRRKKKTRPAEDTLPAHGNQAGSRHVSRVVQEPSEGNHASSLIYRPLDASRLEIRLLELLPGHPGEPLRARLSHASLHDDIKYDALSYMWGETQGGQIMFPDEQTTMPVTENLGKALDNIRLPDRSRVLWCDAVCINQADKNEVAYQVPLMRKLYSCARVVRAWIDVEVDLASAPFQDLMHLEEWSIKIEDAAHWTYWLPVLRVFRDPYWYRIWVQQELILARTATLHCRTRVVPLKAFMNFKALLARLAVSKDSKAHMPLLICALTYLSEEEYLPIADTIRYFPGAWMRTSTSLVSMEKRKLYRFDEATRMSVWYRPAGEDARFAEFNSLLHYFEETLGLGCKDPRDRVYGVLGIANDIDAGDVVVDYQMPYIEVWMQAFQVHIRKHHSLSFLCELKMDPTDQDLPSWMPHDRTNWHVCASDRNRADGGMPFQGAFIDVRTRGLRCAGICVDRISIVARLPFQTSESQLVPFVGAVDRVCRQMWGDETERLYDEREVASVFFEPMDADLYARYYGREPLSAERQRGAVRTLRGLVERAAGLGMHPAKLVSEAEVEGLSEINLKNDVVVGTECGRLGVLRKSQVEMGDEVWVVSGCRMPVVLRKVGEGQYLLMGYSHFPTLMSGQECEGVDEFVKIEIR